MKVLARPAGTGKTKELLETAIKENGTILTTNKRALIAKAYAYSLVGPVDIVEWNDILYGDYDKKKPLFIHKMDDVFGEYLKYDFGLNLEGYSITMED